MKRKSSKRYDATGRAARRAARTELTEREEAVLRAVRAWEGRNAIQAAVDDVLENLEEERHAKS